MTRQSSFEKSGPGRTIYAAASGPGTPGWPLVRLNPVIGNPAEAGNSATKRALLFHELFHLIGYAHDASVFSQMAGPHVPLHTACQICCFPQGFLKASAQCRPAARDRLKARACEICAGDHATSHSEVAGTAFRQIAREFEESVKSCYFNLNPL
jgi:hypothetical protein